MAAKSLVIGALCLVFITTVAAQQDPPPLVCLDTGPLCYSDCRTNPPSGNYQWCGGCKWFIQCVGTNTYYQPCAASTYWDGVSKRCEAVSNTCTECIATTPVETTGSTTQATPPVPPNCLNTGLTCIDDCDVTRNGIFQWCGRCDYFLYCSGSANFFMECPPGLYYDDSLNLKQCEYSSTTCLECDVYLGPTTPSQCYCLNGGVCRGDGTCSCQPGYTGRHCEQVIDYCQPPPCQNGATCVNIIGGYNCVCPPGYTGPHCEFVNNNCAVNPCLNGGTCVNQIGSSTCICLPGWTGNICQSVINNCASHPCLNSGTCINACDMYQCNCPPGYTGTNCQIFINNCASNPCVNGGTCNNYIGGWTCTCPPGRTGLSCQTIFDNCATAPCLNGGTCVNGCNMYQCYCSPTFTGLNCETSYSACVPNPCLNGGTCTTNANGDPVCTCPPQYTGNICQSETYDINLTCGSDLFFTGVGAANGFTRLCYFTAAPTDIASRSTPCWNTLQGLPIYGDYSTLIAAGGALGCVVSTSFPSDVNTMNPVACRPNYQIQVTLGSDYNYIYVCLLYPY